MYLYPFKHTSRVASVTHFNLNNPNHYHCTHATEFCHTAIIPWRGKRKKKPQLSSQPLHVTSPFAGT